VQRRPRMIGAGFIGRLFTQWQRYLSAQYHRARGRFVIFDRYPYDALLQPNRRLNWIKRSSRWLMAHACPAPDLVLLLDAPGDVLYARKGEHSPAFLEQQRQNYLALKASLPQMVIVNAMHDSDKVRREATALIWRTYAQHVQRRAFA
jgi:thymidylate kinase